jgi:hypothetical protein
MRFFALAAVLMNMLFAQNDSIYVEIDGDSVTFWHKNARGRRAAILFQGELRTGINHYITFNASFLPSGIYFYRLTGETGTVSRKMMLLR